MDFAKCIRDRRLALGLGIRETARLTEKSFVPHPIKSAVYLSRIENKVIEEMRAEAVSIDKLWAIGVALRLQPLAMFAISRNLPELEAFINSFAVREIEPTSFCLYLRGRRKDLRFTLNDVAEKSRFLSPWDISPNYLSQLETIDTMAERLQGEKLWAIGRVLDVDPLLLYVLARKIEPRYLSAASRDRLFT